MINSACLTRMGAPHASEMHYVQNDKRPCRGSWGATTSPHSSRVGDATHTRMATCISPLEMLNFGVMPDCA